MAACDPKGAIVGGKLLDGFGEAHRKRAAISGVPGIVDRERTGCGVDASDHVHVVGDEIAARVPWRRHQHLFARAEARGEVREDRAQRTRGLVRVQACAGLGLVGHKGQGGAVARRDAGVGIRRAVELHAVGRVGLRVELSIGFLDKRHPVVGLAVANSSWEPFAHS